MASDFDLEKQRVADRLASMERTFSTFITVSELRLKQNEERLDMICHVVNGNGSPGIAEDVRELKKTKKNFFLVWIAIIPVIVERLWSHLPK